MDGSIASWTWKSNPKQAIEYGLLQHVKGDIFQTTSVVTQMLVEDPASDIPAASGVEMQMSVGLFPWQMLYISQKYDILVKKTKISRQFLQILKNRGILGETHSAIIEFGDPLSSFTVSQWMFARQAAGGTMIIEWICWFFADIKRTESLHI